MDAVIYLSLSLAAFFVLFVVSAWVEGAVYRHRERRAQARQGFPVLPARNQPELPAEKK
jgi:hypothetical protein